MATTLTASIGSGYATNVLFFNEGAQLVMQGHFSYPAADTAFIETGMYDVAFWSIPLGDMDTVTFTAGSNGTIGVYFSGLTVGATGCFEFRGT